MFYTLEYNISNFELTAAATPVNEWTLWPRTIWSALKERKPDCGMPAFLLDKFDTKKEHFLGLLRLQRACWRYENCEIDEVIWLAETAGRSAGRRDNLTPWIRCTSFHFASQDPPIKSRIKARKRHIYPPWKLTYPLKIDGWKMKCSFQNGPLSGVMLILWGVI